MSKKVMFGLLALVMVVFEATGQKENVGIGTTNPDSSAVLELESQDQGFLMTTMDSQSIQAIQNPAEGLMVYNNEDHCYWYVGDGNWSRICRTDTLGHTFIDSLVSYYVNADTIITNYLQSDTAIINQAFIDSLISNYIDADSIFANYFNGDTIIAQYIQSDTASINNAYIDSLISNYINVDSLVTNYFNSDTIIANYLQSDTAVLNQAFIDSLISNYIDADSIFANYFNGDTIIAQYIQSDTASINNAYIDSLVSNFLYSDTIIANYIQSDTAIVDGAFIDSLWANYINTEVIHGDSAFFNYLAIDSVPIDEYITNVMDTAREPAWLLGGNDTLGGSEKLGSLDSSDVVFIGNGKENGRLTWRGAFQVGKNITRLDTFTYSFGKDLINEGGMSLVGGEDNRLAVDAHHSLLWGSENLVGDTTAPGPGVNTAHNFMLGNENVLIGHFGTVLGKRNYMDGYGSFVGGIYNEIEGSSYSFVYGGQNVVRGNRDMVFGYLNAVDERTSYALVFGRNHIVGDTSTSANNQGNLAGFVGGWGNTVNESKYVTALGTNHEIEFCERSFFHGNSHKGRDGDLSMVNGRYVIQEGDFSFSSGRQLRNMANKAGIGGELIYVGPDADNSLVWGKSIMVGDTSGATMFDSEYNLVTGEGHHLETGHHNAIVGRDHQVKSSVSMVAGTDHNNEGHGATLFGRNGLNKGHYSLLAGNNLLVGGNARRSLVFGANNIVGDTSISPGGSGAGGTVVGGLQNDVDALNSAVFGNMNNVTNDPVAGCCVVEALVSGNNNTVRSDHSLTVGSDIDNLANKTMAFGDNISNSGSRSFLANGFPGSTLTNVNDQSFHTKYNEHWMESDGSGNGVYLGPSSGTWNSMSDRNMKKNIREVDGERLLTKVEDLEITKWTYKGQEDTSEFYDEDIDHIGVMAQDFYKAFGLGIGPKRLTTLDLAGVNMKAIQVLAKRTQGSTGQQEEKIQKQEERIEAQAERIEELEERLEQLEKAIKREDHR